MTAKNPHNVQRILAPGAPAVNLFPTLFAPPFVVNRLTPERLTRRLVGFLQPKRDLDGKQGKFSAYYQYCFGPTRRQVANLKSVGYEVEAYHSYYGYAGYWRRVPPIEKLHLALSQVVRQTQTPLLTSFACVVLRKPV